MRHKNLLIFFFLICFAESYAHSDFWKARNFGNVKVRITTGFRYEEINKCWIIGELASKLCRRLGYKDTIFLDFKHHYIEDCIPDCFISFDLGTIKENSDYINSKPFLKRKSIVIREVSRTFDPSRSLKLVEYAIRNVGRIEGDQKQLRYKKNYCDWTISSIDTSLIRRITHSPISEALESILQSKVYRPKSESDGVSEDLSYFYKGGKYHIYYKNHLSVSNPPEEPVLLVVSNIYQFAGVAFGKAIVFDSDSTFYFVEGINAHYASRRHTINHYGGYRPYVIKEIGSDKIAINFCCVGTFRNHDLKDITLLLKIKEDELINLDTLLQKNR